MKVDKSASRFVLTAGTSKDSTKKEGAGGLKQKGYLDVEQLKKA